MENKALNCESDVSASSRRYVAGFASSENEILESLQLRYRIFAGELGAQLETAAAQIDADRYDPHCRHLVVRDASSGRMVASTRLLSETGARAAGGFYSENEFDLSFLYGLPGRQMEVGRTCVDAEFRNGAVIATLWSKLADCVVNENIDYLFGCASVGLQDGGIQAQRVLRYLDQHHLSPATQRVRSYNRLPASDLREATEAPRLPPLLKAYVSLGAKACGEAYWDRDFDCIDVFMLLDVAQLAPRYARRFVRRPADDARANAA